MIFLLFSSSLLWRLGVFFFLILIFTSYRQSYLAIENAEFPHLVLAGNFLRKILNIIQQH